MEKIEINRTPVLALWATDELVAKAYSLYEKFRPDIPEGERGWGSKVRI
jgi:hypothetical protein